MATSDEIGNNLVEYGEIEVAVSVTDIKRDLVFILEFMQTGNNVFIDLDQRRIIHQIGDADLVRGLAFSASEGNSGYHKDQRKNDCKQLFHGDTFLSFFRLLIFEIKNASVYGLRTLRRDFRGATQFRL